MAVSLMTELLPWPVVNYICLINVFDGSQLTNVSTLFAQHYGVILLDL